MIYTKLLILFVMLIFNGCIHKENGDNISRSIKKEPHKVILKKEKFDEFYKRFYSDSNFQISRILFPLPGANSDVIYGDAVVEDRSNTKILANITNHIFKVITRNLGLILHFSAIIINGIYRITQELGYLRTIFNTQANKSKNT